MKTSNKLLLGLFGIIVVAMIIGNVFLKKELKDRTEINQQVEMNSQNDSTSTDSSTVHINLQ